MNRFKFELDAFCHHYRQQLSLSVDTPYTHTHTHTNFVIHLAFIHFFLAFIWLEVKKQRISEPIIHAGAGVALSCSSPNFSMQAGCFKELEHKNALGGIFSQTNRQNKRAAIRKVYLVKEVIYALLLCRERGTRRKEVTVENKTRCKCCGILCFLIIMSPSVPSLFLARPLSSSLFQFSNCIILIKARQQCRQVY